MALAATQLSPEGAAAREWGRRETFPFVTLTSNNLVRQKLPALSLPEIVLSKNSSHIFSRQFAGIGYFSLPLLVHAKAAFLHACEWNPAAVRALKRNLRLNAIPQDRFQVSRGNLEFIFAKEGNGTLFLSSDSRGRQQGGLS